MKLKPCTCCKKELTTKEINRIIRHKDEWIDAIYYNCKQCGSTMILISKSTQAQIREAA